MSSLKQICIKYGADKGHHTINSKGETYADIYDKYFRDIRYATINVLELGVKTGSSINALREYFPNATIYGVDIDPSCKRYEDPSRKVFIGIMSQTDESNLNTFLKDVQFDIIIDDASHVNTLTVKSYEILHTRVKHGGLYIIEDLGCAYFKLESEFNVSQIWPGMKHNVIPTSEFDNNIQDIHSFTNNIIQKLDNGQNIREVYSLSDIAYVHRYKYIMIICKN